MTSCKKTQCLISAFAVFVFIVVFDMVFHQCSYMMNLYQQTAQFWRSKEEIMKMMPWMYAKDVVLALVFTCLFKKFAKGMSFCATTGEKKDCCPIKRGLCFGTKIGLLMGVLQASAYIYMPIPQELAIAWLVNGFVKGLGIGLILSLLCKKAEGSCNTGMGA